MAYFRQKLNLPTERWDDLAGAAHDRAFVVAGAQTADLLADLRGAVGRAIQDGKSLDAFRKEFDAIVAKNGWTGWTGEGSQAGVAWRTRVIYQTNMATSYAAGRWAQLNDPELASLRPYWRYVHSDLVSHPRPQHQAWNGLVLHKDDPFWRSHFPPNGWGCKCTVKAASRAEIAAAQAKGLDSAPAGWDEIGDSTGAPPGIDKGWGHAPGANATRPLLEMVDAKLFKLDALIGAAMWEAMAPTLAMERQLAWWDTLEAWLADEYPRGRTAVVGTLKLDTLSWLADKGLPVPAGAEIAIRDALVRGAKQARHEAAQNALTHDEWRAVPALLESPGAIYLDGKSGKLIYVAEEIGPSKLAVEYDPARIKGIAAAVVESAFRVSDEAIAGAVKGGEWVPVEVSGRRAGVEPA
ncbi:phage minor head protein [Zoogloea sp.]|uniref:phage head morphogenesis protein n=1 Tax=Zoogloea sp. TaxID=49181 RepID=UPI002612B210|nr:phage minor head protein [Zoogloea sp.]MDD3355072.1 phage minor head protein [Zoogloea sp.]